MQTLTESSNPYQGGHFAEATRNILAHLESEQVQGFGLFDQPSDTFSGQGSPSKKGRTDLSITVPRIPTAKQAISSPNSANTTYSPEDEPNITVESRTPTAVASNRTTTQPIVSRRQEAPPARGPDLTQHMTTTNTQPQKIDVAVIANPQKKKSHARKQAAGHIPRPRNAFILFRKHITDNNLIPKSVEVKHQNISIVASKMWAEAPPEVKAQFTEAAKREKEEHSRLYPNYRYQPAYRRTDIIRRRVRKDPLEDDKCEAVASLLIQGKAGNALETEVKEKIAEKTGLGDNPEEIKLVVKRGRRKRKDAPGELSKGAIRAEKAAERARAMREHWIDTSMLLAQQANSHVPQRLAPAYYDDRYQHANVVYVDEFGRPMYEDRYGVPYVDAHERDYYPVDPYGNQMAMGHQGQDHYDGGNMRLPRVETQHPFQMNLAPGIDQQQQQQQLMMEQAQMFEASHAHQNVMSDQAMHYAPAPAEASHQWGMTEQQNLLPFEQHGGQAPQEPMQMQAQIVSSDAHEPANYALDPMLAANPMDPTDGAYGQLAQDGSNFPAMDEYRNISMPSDIIAGRWARDHDGGHDEGVQDGMGNDAPQDQAGNMDSLLPLMEGEHLPSQHIDFGDKGELFGGDLNEVLPMDPDIEDYNAALHQQQDMEGLLGQL